MILTHTPTIVRRRKGIDIGEFPITLVYENDWNAMCEEERSHLRSGDPIVMFKANGGIEPLIDWEPTKAELARFRLRVLQSICFAIENEKFRKRIGLPESIKGPIHVPRVLWS